MNTLAKLSSMQQLMKPDRTMPAMSDDNILVKKIVAEHNPDGLEHDVRPLLHLVEDILRQATITTDGISTVRCLKFSYNMLLLQLFFCLPFLS